MEIKYLDFYFDYLSPYAYFAWRKVTRFCEDRGLELNIHPVVFGKLLDHWGQLGPAEIPPKREWLIKYCVRYAQQHGFNFKGPQFHPFNSLAALRLSLSEVSGKNQQKVVTEIFEAGWARGRDIGDTQTLVSVLESAGIDGAALAEEINKPIVKEQLKNETDKAIELGVFGIPTMIIDEQLFWGNDQFDHITLHLQGNNPFNAEEMEKVIGRERAIDRKRIKY
jgi:2-hydroxychromene-2-carboxylate isomerase